MVLEWLIIKIIRVSRDGGKFGVGEGPVGH